MVSGIFNKYEYILEKFSRLTELLLYVFIQLVRKDLGVYEIERQSNITLGHKSK